MPVAHEAPEGADGGARSDDHPFAAAALGQIGEAAQRFRLGGEHELATKRRNAGYPAAGERGEETVARRRRALVSDEIRKEDVLVRRAREIGQRRRFVRGRDAFDAYAGLGNGRS